jgi:hypothetical protein
MTAGEDDGHDRGEQHGEPPSPPPTPAPAAPATVDLDTNAIDTAMGRVGRAEGGVYKFSIPRRDEITESGMVLPPPMGVTTAIGFQPLGGGRAAINGDFAMTAGEVPNVLKALRAGGISIVSLHNHALNDQPRLFYTHFWAADDAVALAKTLRSALDATAVK